MLHIRSRIAIVLDLARENIISEQDAKDNELEDERQKCIDACNEVQEYFNID